jgi:asparagine synthase (glutamine-hydrolysing)
MCGIAGVIGKGEQGNELIRVMTDAIIHRGPDDEGHYVDATLALGMRRLSIIDLEGGKQPITSQNENFVIVFNGEIYNYKALRAQLIKRGYKFKTHTDTEVILHLFEDEGALCLGKLRGMFAFAIFDKRKQKLFIARDFFGIKPLYYYVEDGRITAFGSEIKSILTIPGVARMVNDEAVVNYLSFQYNPLKETFFKNIFKLSPGSFLDIDLAQGTFTEKRYAEFSFGTNSQGPTLESGALRSDLGNFSEEKWTQELIAVLDDSVKHHMVSDVPVGSFLSGGIDSGIIAALAQKNLKNRKLSTFTIGFDEVTEAREAEVTARRIGTSHKAITISRKEYFKELPKIVWHFDEPVADPSAAALYFVAREARKKVKVVMSGEGADELFGGYNIYLESYARRRLMIVPKFIREYFLRPLAGSKLSFRGKNFLIRFFSNIEDWYIGNAQIFSHKEIGDLWKGGEGSRLSLAPLYKKVTGRQDSEKMQYIDINTWLPGDILAKADKMTMAHSLELRVPFLDREVQNFARNVPPSLKWKNYTTKYLLRRVADVLLTSEISRRKKLGFPTPVKKWFDASQTELYTRITKNTYIREHFNVSVIEQLIADHMSGRADNARKLYLLLLLALWHDIYIGKTMVIR